MSRGRVLVQHPAKKGSGGLCLVCCVVFYSSGGSPVRPVELTGDHYCQLLSTTSDRPCVLDARTKSKGPPVTCPLSFCHFSSRSRLTIALHYRCRSPQNNPLRIPSGARVSALSAVFVLQRPLWATPLCRTEEQPAPHLPLSTGGRRQLPYLTHPSLSNSTDDCASPDAVGPWPFVGSSNPSDPPVARTRQLTGNMSRSDARFSTYSGAPSLQPSLAPTYDTVSNRSSTQHYHSRFSEHTFPASQTIPERSSRTVYAGGDPSAAASSLTLSANDPKTAELRSFANLLDRMSDQRAEKQRFEMSTNKTEEVAKIALGAKVERALARRMVGQDAVFRTRKPLDEKLALEVQAN